MDLTFGPNSSHYWTSFGVVNECGDWRTGSSIRSSQNIVSRKSSQVEVKGS